MIGETAMPDVRGSTAVDAGAAMDRSLAEIGSLLAGDRVCPFEPSDDGAQVSNTRAWRASGVEARRESLQALPTDALEIDQSLVAGMLQHTGDRAIVNAVIARVRVFGRRSVADGVETPEHVAAPRELGCDMPRGFGIAPPMPKAACLEWRRHRPDRRSAVLRTGNEG